MVCEKCLTELTTRVSQMALALAEIRSLPEVEPRRATWVPCLPPEALAARSFEEDRAVRCGD